MPAGHDTFHTIYMALFCFLYICCDNSSWWLHDMMTSPNGNIFRVTGHLYGEFTGPRWLPPTKASDAELWCSFDLRPDKLLNKQWWGWWFETTSGPLWRQCNEVFIPIYFRTIYLNLDNPSIMAVAADLLLSRHLSNFRSVGQLKRNMLRLRDFARSGSKTYYCLVLAGQGWMCVFRQNMPWLRG